MKSKEKWDTSFFNSSPLIKQLKPYTDLFKHFSTWPTIENYQTIFKQLDVNVLPVPQSLSVNSFEEQYEPRVFLKKELQTRTENWHDFFNALIWLKFPLTKIALNQLHFKSAKNRPKGSNRSTLENRITQFDECGAIIISNNKFLLDLIREHKWNELFIEQRKRFEADLYCVVFGHAILEKALTPYIGMTCHCILLEDPHLLEHAQSWDVKDLDKHISLLWLEQISQSPEKFAAFPVLGIPGLWPEQNADFYSNTKYFR